MMMMDNFTKEVEFSIVCRVPLTTFVLSDQNGDFVGYVLSRKKSLFVALLYMWKTNKLNLCSQA